MFSSRGNLSKLGARIFIISIIISIISIIISNKDGLPGGEGEHAQLPGAVARVQLVVGAALQTQFHYGQKLKEGI